MAGLLTDPFVLLVGSGLLAGAVLLAHVRTLPPTAPVLPDGMRISVVVPARDEEASLPALLTSLSALEPAPAEVIVVDDASRDATATIAIAAGATVVAAADPPPGWLGKPWACDTGVRLASGTHYLFLDADTQLAPDGLARLAAAHARHSGLVSVQPYHRTVRAYEELSAYSNVVSMMASGAFGPGRGGSRLAFGPCLFTAAAEYATAGGHAAVRGEIVEDLGLARAYRAGGSPVHVYAGGDTVQFRMYPGGFRQLVEGWTKNIAVGASSANRLLVILTVLWVAAHATVAASVATSVAGWLLGDGSAPGLALAAWAVTTAQLRWMLARIGSFRWWTALAFPVPLVVFVVLFMRSLVRTVAVGRVEWRGREISLRRNG